MPITQRATFSGPGGRYKVLKGSLYAGFGNPAPSLLGDPPEIEFRLPAPSKVTFVGADFTRPPWNKTGDVGVYIYLYDSDDNQLGYHATARICEALEYNCPFKTTGKSFNVNNVSRIHYTMHIVYVSGGLLDNCIITYEPHGVALTPSAHESSDCTMGVYAQDQPFTNVPVGLRDGDKSEAVVDLRLNTLTGPFEFQRSYRQSKQGDPGFQHTSGLGWTHNHNIYLDTSTAGVIFAYLTGGGRAQFLQDTADRFVAASGGTSTITVNPASSQERYELVSENQSLVFDEYGQLQRRQWVSGAQLSYLYYPPPHFAAGRLREVHDGYGRKFQLHYIDSNDFDHLQLWRVGDQTAAGLDTATPSGNYVEYGYVPTHLDGVPTTPGLEPLLWQVRDVRGHVWSYQYYGYEVGENAAALVQAQSKGIE